MTLDGVGPMRTQEQLSHPLHLGPRVGDLRQARANVRNAARRTGTLSRSARGQIAAYVMRSTETPDGSGANGWRARTTSATSG
jgi:hypothetical protein